MYLKLILGFFIFGRVSSLPYDEKRLREEPLPKEIKNVGIYGGIPTTVQRHPFMIAIIMDDAVFSCAGTIIDQHWVVSSAVCLDGLDAEDLTVVAASNDGYTGDSYDVEKLVFHPNYDPRTLDYAYVLIKINDAFKWKSKVKAINLPTSDLTEQTNMLVSGWGYTGANDVYNMRQGGMKWMPKSFCSSEFDKVNIKFTDRMACAYNEGKTTLCGNDYGDPIVHKGILYGVFVYPYDYRMCTSQAGPVLLADVYQAVDWIKDTINTA